MTARLGGLVKSRGYPRVLPLVVATLLLISSALLADTFTIFPTFSAFYKSDRFKSYKAAQGRCVSPHKRTRTRDPVSLMSLSRHVDAQILDSQSENANSRYQILSTTINPADDPQGLLNEMSSTSKDGDTCSSTNSPSLDLASPRLWLEAMPNGAYTVFRSDFHGQRRSSSIIKENIQGDWDIWGLSFHLDRITKSYKSFMELNAIQDEDDRSFHVARNESVDIIQCLLKYAKKELLENGENGDDSFTPITNMTAMITILWHPLSTKTLMNESDTESRSIHVKGHISLLPTPSVNLPEATAKVIVAIEPFDNQTPLPNRLPFPDAKLSSWCTSRRPLETTFKTPEFTEVILSQASPDSSSLYLLEGLTTNLFVHYRDGTLRTSPSNTVLGGYARHLVLEQASKMGISVSFTPPKLEECDLWFEVFLTSSIKLIVPIQKVFVPAYVPETWGSQQDFKNNGKGELSLFRTAWSIDKENDQSKHLWRRLLLELGACMLSEDELNS